MAWQTRMTILILAALIAGQALHWFISGSSAGHSGFRNTMVGLQALIGVAMLVWGFGADRRRIR